MFNFFQAIFGKITSLVASAIISVGIVSMPAIEPMIVQETQQPPKNEEVAPQDDVEEIVTEETGKEVTEEENLASVVKPMFTFVPEPTTTPVPTPLITPTPTPTPTATPAPTIGVSQILQQIQQDVQEIKETITATPMPTPTSIPPPAQITIESTESPTNPNDANPFLKISSNRPIRINKLVFFDDASYCNNGYAYTQLTLQYLLQGKDAERDFNNRFIFDYSDLVASDFLFRLTAGVRQVDALTSNCTYEGMNFKFLGSESLVYNESGEKMNLPNVILRYSASTPTPTPTPLPQPKFTSEPYIKFTETYPQFRINFAVDFGNAEYTAVNCRGGNYLDGVFYAKSLKSGVSLDLRDNENGLVQGAIYNCTFYLNNVGDNAKWGDLLKNETGNYITKSLSFTVPEP